LGRLQTLQAHDELRAGRAFERHVLIGKQRMIDTLSFRSES
jgi:hypothetical protein